MPRIASGDGYGPEEEDNHQTKEIPSTPTKRDSLAVSGRGEGRWVEKDVGTIRSVGEGDEVVGTFDFLFLH